MDLLWVILTTFLFFFISAQYQISEKIQLLTLPWERFQVDELPVTLLFFFARADLVCLATGEAGYKRVTTTPTLGSALSADVERESTFISLPCQRSGGGA